MVRKFVGVVEVVEVVVGAVASRSVDVWVKVRDVVAVGEMRSQKKDRDGILKISKLRIEV